MHLSNIFSQHKTHHLNSIFEKKTLISMLSNSSLIFDDLRFWRRLACLLVKNVSFVFASFVPSSFALEPSQGPDSLLEQMPSASELCFWKEKIIIIIFFTFLDFYEKALRV